MVVTRALPAVVRLLWPGLLLAAGLTAALLMLGSGAAHADASVLPARGLAKATDTVVRSVSSSESQLPRAENAGGAAPVAPPVEPVPVTPATSAGRDSTDYQAPAANPLARPTSVVPRLVQRAAVEEAPVAVAPREGADVAAGGVVQRSVTTVTTAATAATVTDEAVQAVDTLAAQTQETVKTVIEEPERVLRVASGGDVLEQVADVVVVGGIATDVPLVDVTAKVTLDIAAGVGGSNVVGEVDRTLDEATEHRFDTDLPEPAGATAGPTAGPPSGSSGVAVLGPRAAAVGAVSGPAGGWAPTSQRDTTTWNDPFPAETPGAGSSSSPTCEGGKLSAKTGGGTPYSPTPATTGTSTGTSGTSSSGGTGPGWDATQSSAWSAPVMVGLQPSPAAVSRPLVGPCSDPGFSPD